MEVFEQNEAFVEEDDDLVFSHIKIILRESNQYYYAIYHRYFLASKIWPPFPTHFGRASEPIP
jgi:hypothetical protein